MESYWEEIDGGYIRNELISKYSPESTLSNLQNMNGILYGNPLMNTEILHFKLKILFWILIFQHIHKNSYLYNVSYNAVRNSLHINLS